jgi:aerobic-type carbon monoxide dehydrogenase small subunit (CoxS/CutS family)
LLILIDGKPFDAPENATAAAALLTAGQTTFRRSVSGEPRAPLCGMGICFECRVTIDGHAHARSCQIPVRDGMEIRTG